MSRQSSVAENEILDFQQRCVPKEFKLSEPHWQHILNKDNKKIEWCHLQNDQIIMTKNKSYYQTEGIPKALRAIVYSYLDVKEMLEIVIRQSKKELKQFLTYKIPRNQSSDPLIFKISLMQLKHLESDIFQFLYKQCDQIELDGNFIYHFELKLIA